MTTARDLHIEWDNGTAYDFFISLIVLHDPEKYGLRGSWAAGVRSRLPATERDLLQQARNIIWPMRWVHTLPPPRDARTAIEALRALPPVERLIALMPAAPEDVIALLNDVAGRHAWNDDDLRQLIALMQEGDWQHHPPATVRKDALDIIGLWADASGSGDGLLSAFECYYDSFFAEEEARIRPMLDIALARAQKLAKELPQDALLEELSQGVRLADVWEDKSLVVGPSFWATPLVILAKLHGDKTLFMFGARPADESLIPGDMVPDALYQALKALADPTRLRILRYLSDEPLAPAELARRLRLRSPTVIHHLDALRLARLVIVTLEVEGKRYAIRPDAVAAVCDLLQGFLAGREE